MTSTFVENPERSHYISINWLHLQLICGMICLTGLPRSRSEAIIGHHDISQTLKGTPRSDTSDVGIAGDAG